MKEQKKCPKCKSSKIGEKDIHDDMDGTLHCFKCDAKFDKWTKGSQRRITRNVAKFDHEDECKGRKESIGHRFERGMEIHSGWFCKSCDRLMMGGKMWKYINDCSRVDAFMHIG